MSEYAAPLAEMAFVLQELAGLPEVCSLPGYENAGDETTTAVLAEAARFAREVLDPLNAAGDRAGALLAKGIVTAPPGYAAAYRQFAAAGWGSLSAPQRYGGQALPRALAVAVEEMWGSANLALSLAPMLTAGVVEALVRHGSPEQQALYLPPLVTGRWCGTMNLTEPQAGSDLSAVRTLATPDGDAYRLRGTKMFITWGEHDLAENIIHLVLARTPDAPAGVRGISLFVVPKLLVRADGSCGARNDVTCVAIERKLGLHGSPTCLLSYGEQDGAVGHLVGERHRGLEYMFTMMNYARLSVGIEGVAVAERAYQHALAYAKARVQGREPGASGAERVAIIRHPDVRRMLLSMKVRTQAMRALAYFTAAAYDNATHHADPAERRRNQAYFDVLTPAVKGWCTEQAVDIASLGVQVHGGMGYVEETGAAQYLRDARVTPIYEGTTGIQANDLVGRKIAGDGGAAAFALLREMQASVAGAAAQHAGLHALAGPYSASIGALQHATHSLLAADARAAAAVAVPYLELFGTVAGGWMMLRAAAAALRRGDTPPAQSRLAAARFYAAHVLTRVDGLAAQVSAGSSAVTGYDDAWW